MKLIHRLSLFVIVVLVAVPLVIMAQDNGQPSNPNDDDDLVVPLVPTNANSDDDLVVPLVPTNANSDDDLVVTLPPGGALTVTPYLPLAQTATLELLEYPGTATPTVKPRPTTEPSTSIVNGLWVLDPNASGFTKSGQCNIPGGDNGGSDGNGQDVDYG